MDDPSHLIRRLGVSFSDETVLYEALTHRSCGSGNYERLEFLGDSLLNFTIAAELFRRHPDEDEGSLSRLRASLVRESTLADVARELQLGEYLRLGIGELKSGGFKRDSILSDVVESLIGAVYLDSGFDEAQALVLRLLANKLDNLPPAADLKDPKTRLQELLQGRGLERPVYEVVEKAGKSHEMKFTVQCTLAKQGVTVQAIASSRRKAEQSAAADILARADKLLPVS
ncbi:MAG: ribonuclease III [Granulosicoccus sp.]